MVFIVSKASSSSSRLRGIEVLVLSTGKNITDIGIQSVQGVLPEFCNLIPGIKYIIVLVCARKCQLDAYVAINSASIAFAL